MDNSSTPTPSEFAALVRRRLDDLGIDGAKYQPEEFCFELPDGLVVNLHNIFRDTADLTAEDRSERVTRFLSALRADEEVPTDWESARPTLFPVLRPSTYGGQAMRPLSRPAFPFIDELIAIDMPDKRVLVTTDHVTGWGVTVFEVFEAARENLAAKPPSIDLSDGGLTRIVDTGDFYATSWPLLPGWLASLGAEGRRAVAFIPEDDALILTLDEPELLEQLFDAVEDQYVDAVRRLSPQAYTTDERGVVVPFDRAGPHPQLPAANRARCGLATTEYQAQHQELMEALEEEDGFAPFGIDPAYPCELLFAHSDNGFYTIAPWAAEIDTLLPEADYIDLCLTDDNDEIIETLAIPFATLVANADLVPVRTLSPPRYLAKTWPDTPTLARLRAAAVDL
ncbi:hypothetical protein [Nocardia amikacinitolerans]|uniref:hypothetical protein n=1 Tax=Nocardia amikacinitolerans TaxID=756689 RepID=UPI000B017A08|nr:hypothetical protein [Nocardia amikacinitolerans]